MTTRWLALVALLATAAAWGGSFVVTKGAFEHLSPLAVVAARLIITGAVLGVVFIRQLRMPVADLVWGSALGLIFAAALATQTIGLGLIAPSMSGFLTATYVLFTAVIVSVLFRQRQPWTTWVAVIVMVAGISVLAVGQTGQASDLRLGVIVSLIGALLYAVHIVFLGRRVTRRNLSHLIVMQAVAGGAAGMVMWPSLGEPLPTDPSAWWPLLYLGVVSGAIALLTQTWAQSIVAATPAAVIMCSEPVWAAGLAVAWGFELFTASLLVGGSLVVIGLLLAVLPGERGRTADDVVEDLGDTGQGGA